MGRQNVGVRTENERLVRRAILISFSASLLLLVALIALYRPYFGNMDDSLHMQLAGQAPFWVFHHFGDLSTGFARQASWLVMWPQYALAAATKEPATLYMFNAFVVLAIVLVFLFAARSYFQWISWQPSIAFFGAFLAWPYFSEILVFPSLQEKSVILGAGLLLWWVSNVDRPQRALAKFALLALLTAIAFTSKTQVVILIPGLVAALWLGGRPGSNAKQLWLKITATIVWISFSFILVALAYRSSYSAGTQGGNPPSVPWEDSRFQLVGTIFLAYNLFLAIQALRGKWDSRALVPWLWIACILGAFAVWEIRNYYLAIASIGVGTALAIAVGSIQGAKLKSLLALALLGVGFFVVFLRVSLMFSITHSFDEFLRSSMAVDLNMGAESIAVGCLEAPTHFNIYADWSGLHELEFVHVNEAKPTNFRLSDSRLCPIQQDESWQEVWRGSSGDGYILYASREAHSLNE